MADALSDRIDDAVGKTLQTSVEPFNPRLGLARGLGVAAANNPRAAAFEREHTRGFPNTVSTSAFVGLPK